MSQALRIASCSRPAVAAALFAILLGACASPPPPPAVIAATVTAADDLNPDASGRASPVVMRLFELKGVAAFNAADFFSLWDRESDVLGADLVAREEVLLRPGEHKSIERTLQPDTQHVAVIAAFRDLDRARWRVTVAVVQHARQPITIMLESRSVSIQAM